MILKQEVILIHAKLIETYGGTQGIRDMGLLESSLNRPFATFDELDLYITPIEKAAALLESLLINHPFIDGNKRIAYTVARLFLMSSGIDIQATINEKYDFIIQIAKGEISIEQIKEWLTTHTYSL